MAYKLADFVLDTQMDDGSFFDAMVPGQDTESGLLLWEEHAVLRH